MLPEKEQLLHLIAQETSNYFLDFTHKSNSKWHPYKFDHTNSRFNEFKEKLILFKINQFSTFYLYEFMSG